MEVGGQRGREALDRLRNVVGRVESSWRPASAEEGFEIVRRRLFEPIAERRSSRHRDVVARAFADLYRTQHQEFPPECRDADYEKRIRAAYPIHPEIFDRLYTDWSTLVKFQRTRGVLRLMAAVIHSLWEKGDRNPLILPANIAIDDPARAVRADALPLGQLGAGHREGRGRAELAAAAAGRRGAQPGQVCGLPARGAHHLPGFRAHGHGGPPRPRGSAGEARLRHAGRVAGGLRRCPAAAGRRGHLPLPGRHALLVLDPAHRHQAGRGPRRAVLSANPTRWCRSWSSACARTSRSTRATSAASTPCPSRARTCPTTWTRGWSCSTSTTPTARSRAARPRRRPRPSSKSRGNTPRLYRNTLVFLAADKTRLQDLDEAARRYLAWESILAEKETLNLDPQQVKQAETQKGAADSTVTARLPETYQWLLVPGAGNAPGRGARGRRSGCRGRMRWPCASARSCATTSCWSRPLPPRACAWSWTACRSGAATTWPSGSWSRTFARYLYLPRLKDPTVLIGAIQGGFGLLTWVQDSFAYAESYDEAAGRYRGLRGGQQIAVTAGDSGLLVRPEVARRQLEAEIVVATPVVDPLLYPASDIPPGPTTAAPA